VVVRVHHAAANFKEIINMTNLERIQELYDRYKPQIDEGRTVHLDYGAIFFLLEYVLELEERLKKVGKG
jgi:hypothetical protein